MYNSLWDIYSCPQFMNWVTPELSKWCLRLLGRLIHHQCSDPKFYCGNPCLCILRFWLTVQIHQSRTQTQTEGVKVIYGHYCNRCL